MILQQKLGIVRATPRRGLEFCNRKVARGDLDFGIGSFELGNGSCFSRHSLLGLANIQETALLHRANCRILSSAQCNLCSSLSCYPINRRRFAVQLVVHILDMLEAQWTRVTWLDDQPLGRSTIRSPTSSALAYQSKIITKMFKKR